MTMACGPLASVCATSAVTSKVPSAQLVLVTDPALVSIVVVPAALQFQVGDVAKFALHCVASMLTDGGTTRGVHTHLLPVHVVLVQSVPVLHALPEAHGGHPPPQSTSVSVPFFAPSVLHCGAVHVFAMQLPF
jgi:hypothetical protein